MLGNRYFSEISIILRDSVLRSRSRLGCLRSHRALCNDGRFLIGISWLNLLQLLVYLCLLCLLSSVGRWWAATSLLSLDIDVFVLDLVCMLDESWLFLPFLIRSIRATHTSIFGIRFCSCLDKHGRGHFHGWSTHGSRLIIPIICRRGLLIERGWRDDPSIGNYTGHIDCGIAALKWWSLLDLHLHHLVLWLLFSVMDWKCLTFLHFFVLDWFFHEIIRNGLFNHIGCNSAGFYRCDRWLFGNFRGWLGLDRSRFRRRSWHTLIRTFNHIDLKLLVNLFFVRHFRRLWWRIFVLSHNWLLSWWLGFLLVAVIWKLIILFLCSFLLRFLRFGCN